MGRSAGALRRDLVAGVLPRQALVLPCAIGLLARLTVMLLGDGVDRFQFEDSPSYLIFARELPTALWRPSAEAFDDTLIRTPGYPIFSWIVSAGGWSIIAIVVAQCILGGVVNVALCARLGRRLGGASVGVIAAWVVALDPATIGHDLLISTETLFTTVMLVTLLSVDHLARGLRAGALTLATAGTTAVVGGLIGLGVLVRPVFVTFIPLFAAGLALAARGRRRWLVPAGVVLTALIPTVGWQLRNLAVADAFVLSTVQGQNLYALGLGAAATERDPLPIHSTTAEQGANIDAVRLPFERAHREELDNPGPVERHRAWSRLGLELALEHPRGLAIQGATTITRTLTSAGHELVLQRIRPSWQPKARGPLAAWAVLWLLSLYSLAAVGASSAAVQRRWRMLAICIGPSAWYLLASMGPGMYIRFRLPITPMIAILFAVGVVHLRQLRASSRDANRSDLRGLGQSPVEDGLGVTTDRRPG